MLHRGMAMLRDGLRKRDRLARSRMIGRCRWLAVAVSALLVAGCASNDPGRLRICERALAALEPGSNRVAAETLPADRVVVRYRLADAELQLECEFAPRTLDSDGLDLVAVATAREGALSPAVLFLLKTYGLGQARGDSAKRLPASAYLAQQVANALAPSAIYALLATGYALIYGITGRINLAFGEFTTVGAFAALAGVLIGGALPAGVPGLVLGGLLLAAATGAALGAVLHALVFAPLLGRGSQALLIATIGLAIALAEGLRLLSGSGQRWLQPLFTAPLRLGAVHISSSQMALALLALALIAALIILLRRSAFGRAYRACSDDPGAAALMGIDVGRTVGRACVLGSVLAAVAGYVLTMHYGVVGFGMGTLLGLKALTAAVVGGIGSVPGAALGGVLIGLFESLWAGYLPGAYREVALFVVLAVVLALRPDGLLGQPPAVTAPTDWRRFGR